MKLAIITNDGEVIEVEDNLEDYNLDKSIARSVIVDKIRLTIHSLIKLIHANELEKTK